MHQQSEKNLFTHYLLHMYPEYGELRPTSGWYLLASLGHLSKFQPVSRLGFVTAATSLTGGQPNFARCLAVSWAHNIYMSEGSCPLTEFCQLQNSLCIQVLRSPMLAALLHGTRAAVFSQTLWRGTRNGIMELLQRAPTMLAGRPSCTASAHILLIFHFYPRDAS